MSRIQFVLISSDSEDQKRGQALCRDFEYQGKFARDTDEILDWSESEIEDVKFVLLSAKDVQKPEEIAGRVQVAKQVFPRAFIAAVVDKRVPVAVSQFVKKSGASCVLLENEVHRTSKLEFFASQVIRAAMVPIKAGDISPGLAVPFTLFHLMPLNQKMMAVVAAGQVVSEAKLAKLKEVNEFYVRREEVHLFKAYLEQNPRLSADGLLSRCRAQYLQFCHGHTKLIFSLSDQSEVASFDQGRELYGACFNLAKDLLTSLASVGDAWSVISQSSLGEFGSLERAPTLAAYAGLTSFLKDIGDPTEVMLAALLADLGMLELSPEITKKLREHRGVQGLNDEEKERYRSHPRLSLNRAMGQKLQLSENIKQAILASHEQACGQGFPVGLLGGDIPAEAQLLFLAETLDQETMVKMGQERKRPEQVQQQILNDIDRALKYFTPTFRQKLLAN